MTESDERLETVSKKIDQAKSAAKSLSEKDLIDPDTVEGEAPGSVDQATGRAPAEQELGGKETAGQDRGPTPEP